MGFLFPLVFGGLLYIFFRADSLLMFKWFRMLNLTNVINEIRNYTIPINSFIPNWVLYSLPDGLWLFSYVSLQLYLWKNEINFKNIFWILLIPTIAISSEVGQLIKVVPGTFDLTDLFFYILGSTLPVILYNPLITIKKQII